LIPEVGDVFLYDIETNEFFVSRDVKFSEIDFPFAYLPKEDLPTIPGLGRSDVDLEEFDDLRKKDGARHDDHVVPDAIPVQHEVDVIPPVNNTSVQEPNEQDDQEFHKELLGRGHRQKIPSILLHDYVTHTIRKLSPFPLTPKLQHSSGNSYPIAHYVNCNNFSLRRRMFLATIHVDREPGTYFEAVKDERWGDAM